MKSLSNNEIDKPAATQINQINTLLGIQIITESTPRDPQLQQRLKRIIPKKC